MIESELLATAQAWLAEDPDPLTQNELRELIERDAQAELAERFRAFVPFGTAGLRALRGAGPARLNATVVLRASAAIARYLLDRPRRTRSVVVGFDARYNSAAWGVAAAEVFAGFGLKVWLFKDFQPTPLLAFAVKSLEAGAGIMLTASHNPGQYGGYKVYLGDEDEGSQIIPSQARDIAQLIEKLSRTPLRDLPKSLKITPIGQEVVEEYCRLHLSELSRIKGTTPKALAWAYTPMHGVGAKMFLELTERAGLSRPAIVKEQFNPDPNFPTTPFPNPEEPLALELAEKTAREQNCELILAHDPDADRLAVEVWTGQGYRRLSGDELGLLLGLEIAKTASGGSLSTSMPSTPLLGNIAAKYGLDFIQFPSGFKWISRAQQVVYGFEEALGYMCYPGLVRDKDGLSAGVALLYLAERLKASGQTLLDSLAQIREEFGFFATDQLTVVSETDDRPEKLMREVRQHPWPEIGGLKTERITDLIKEAEPADLIRFELATNAEILRAQVIIRPSGTEPKLKCYIHINSQSPDWSRKWLERIRTECRSRLKNL